MPACRQAIFSSLPSAAAIRHTRGIRCEGHEHCEQGNRPPPALSAHAGTSQWRHGAAYCGGLSMVLRRDEPCAPGVARRQGSSKLRHRRSRPAHCCSIRPRTPLNRPLLHAHPALAHHTPQLVVGSPAVPSPPSATSSRRRYPASRGLRRYLPPSRAPVAPSAAHLLPLKRLLNFASEPCAFRQQSNSLSRSKNSRARLGRTFLLGIPSGNSGPEARMVQTSHSCSRSNSKRRGTLRVNSPVFRRLYWKTVPF